jgi:hypothetical protein
MTSSIIRASLMAAALIGTAGCATTSRVVVNPNAKHADYRTVYVVVHGDNSSDMDANLQREFMRHGYTVSAGPGGVMPAGTELVARYADNWRWDMAMYLRSLDVMVYDAKSNVLLASGSWKNSTMHGFYGSEKVVAKVVDQTLTQMGSPQAQ